MKRKLLISGFLLSCLLTACSFDVGNYTVTIGENVSDEDTERDNEDDEDKNDKEDDLIDEPSISSQVISENAPETSPEENDEEDVADKSVSQSIADSISIVVNVPSDNMNLQNRDEIMELVETLKDMYYSEADGYIKTLTMFETAKEIIRLSTYDFSNKHITFIGDSLTYGSGGSEKPDGTRFNYTDTIREVLGCNNITNLSYPGSTVGAYGGGVYVDVQVYKVPEDSDIIVVMIGVNDFISFNDYYGNDVTSPGTYKFYCYKLMSDLRNKCPNADIFFVTTYRNREEKDTYIDHSIANQISLESFMNVQKEIAPTFNIRMIDLYHQGFLNNTDNQSYNEFFTDLLHPNDDGSRLIGKYIAAQIIAYYYSK